ncbi:helix-turn-helix domain-containing protein [Phenylobacterium sp. VNQ135]|uniref:helix-turn-helix domain-containing protein n=1 Tax=Phenylobacterium sp. VNQ135 TaxID=3400922 RepID=UPI003C0324F9
MLTATQIRAARALLGWSQPALAKASGLSLPTIVRMESQLGPGRSSAANVEAVQRALESAGVLFLEADDASAVGPGVRLKQSS